MKNTKYRSAGGMKRGGAIKKKRKTTKYKKSGGRMKRR